MNNKTTNVRYLAQLALLAAIEVVMKLMVWAACRSVRCTCRS